jgi:hypothetical protein
MKKRLRKKLGKLRLDKPKQRHSLSFLKNSATFFCGERRIVEYYNALQQIQPDHTLLSLGEVREDGHFRFTQRYVQNMPKHLQHIPVYLGVPVKPQHGLEYATQLIGASLDLN